MSNTRGHTNSTMNREVNAMSWIMIGASRPSTGVGLRVVWPSGPTTAHVRYGASSA